MRKDVLMKAKRILTNFVITAVLVILFAISASAKTTGVTSGQVNVRSGPGTKSYDVIYRDLPAGVTVNILATENCNDGSTSKPWYKVTFTYNGQNYEGYISSGYVSNVTYSDDDDTYTTEVPAEYASYISALKAKHPNWTFKFYNTGLEWSDVVAGETTPGKNAISGTKPISYRSTSYNFSNTASSQEGYVSGNYIVINGSTATVKTSGSNLNMRSGTGTNYSLICTIPNGSSLEVLENSGNGWYKVRYTNGSYTFTPIEGSSWYQAHGQVVQYYLDPRNFLDDQSVFMFENLSFNASVHTVAGVQNILSNAAWASGTLQTTDGRTISYAEAFYEAGQKYGVSPYHLASRAVQEVGTSGSNAAWGNNSTYQGIYNFYSIGANTGMMDGLKWASESGSYGRPWNTAYKSIVGGAEFIAKGYISVGQSSLYLQKFDLIPTGGLYNHQYMSNISAPASESIGVYNGYKNVGGLETGFEFVIPVFKNMPILACKLPVSSDSPNMAKDTDVAYIFPDVASGEWYYNAVKFNVEKGYFKGYANGYFGPADNIQRQDFVVVLAKIANADLSAYKGQNGNFADVPANDYYSAAIAWARANKILSGYADGRFGVGDPITREQACVIFYNYCKGSVSGDVNTVLAGYPDGSAVSDWARTAVAWAAENHVVGGNGKLNPVGNANRAEMAQIIMNMSNNNIL